MASKKDMSWIASGLREGFGVMTVDVEATGVMVVGVDGTILAEATLGVSALSVVGFLGTRMSSPDSRDIGVIGSESILDPAETVSKQNDQASQKRTCGVTDHRSRGARHRTRDALLWRARPEQDTVLGRHALTTIGADGK